MWNQYETSQPLSNEILFPLGMPASTIRMPDSEAIRSFAVLTSSVKQNQPWASGPGEILQHGVNLLQKDTDTNRRLAMLSIDNAVELMIKTYLGLPKRITGLSLSRKEFDDISKCCFRGCLVSRLRSTNLPPLKLLAIL